MKEIKILGTGCPKCNLLFERTNKVISENNMDCSVEKVEDIMQIMGFGVMMTPALVVDKEVKITGKVPTEDEIKAFIQ